MKRTLTIITLTIFSTMLAANYYVQSEKTNKFLNSLTFFASFDGNTDADFSLGDNRIYTAPDYNQRVAAKPGLSHTEDVVRTSGKGLFGDALEFRKKSKKVVFYRAEKNVEYSNKAWEGTLSFWLRLDPSTDLEPGYCDPIQVTDAEYNDAAIWVDFTDKNPRDFRLGVIGDLNVWNPDEIGPEVNPEFKKRLVVVEEPPFSRGEWTHVLITYSGLNTGNGQAKLFLNGTHQGTHENISDPFSWDDTSKAYVFLGLNYVGLFDELAIFNKALSDQEVEDLYQLEGGIKLHLDQVGKE